MEKLFKSKITGKWVVVGAGAYATIEEAQKVYKQMYGEEDEAASDDEEEKEVRINLLVSSKVKTKLQMEAKRNGMNLSALTRKIITDFLKEAETK